METKRRALLTAPGEPLIVSLSPIESAIRFGQFAEATGVPRTSLAVSSLCSIPLPIYPRAFDAPRRWSSVRPDAMWHPLLWMPSRIANRYEMGGEPGRLEDDDLWSVRVALEMSASGLYDDQSGSWVDILALIGIDIDTDDGYGRVRRWLDGGNDTELDGLDAQVADLVELGEPDTDWAAVTAAESLDGLRVSSWALTADSLVEMCLAIQSSYVAGSRRPNLKSVVSTVTNLAYVSFVRSPNDPTVGEREQAYWQTIVARAGALAEGDDGGAIALLGQAQGRLTELRDHFWPLMQKQADQLANVG